MSKPLKLAILSKYSSQRAFLESIHKTLPINETRLSKIITGHVTPRPDELRMFARELGKPASELFPAKTKGGVE